MELSHISEERLEEIFTTDGKQVLEDLHGFIQFHDELKQMSNVDMGVEADTHERFI